MLHIDAMPTPEEIAAALASELTKPASTSIEGNSVSRRGLSELSDLQNKAAADAAAAHKTGGVKRSQLRHRGPAGGPTQ